MPEVELTQSQFEDRVKHIARECYEDLKDEGDLDPGMSEKIAEEVNKAFRDWQQKTQSERKSALSDLEDMLVSADERQFGGRDQPVEKGALFSRYAPFFIDEAKSHGSVDMGRVKEKAKSGIGQTGYTDKFVEESTEKFLNTGDVAAGGGFVPTPVADDYIELLRPNVVMRQAGATEFRLPEGGTKIPVQTSGVNSESIGEGESASASEPTWELKQMDAVKISSLVVLSNDLIRRSPTGVEQIVRQDARRSAIAKEDADMLFGDGSGGTMKGVYEATHADNKFERSLDSGNVTIDTIIRDLNKAAYKVELADIMPMRPGWTGHPRTFRYLRTLRGSDSLLFASQLAQGTLQGDPIYPTTSFPRTLDDSGDATNDETRLAYGDFSQCLIGDTLNMRIASSQEATVNLPTGWKSMLTADMTAIVVFHEVGFMLRRPKSFAWITGNDWGAGLDG